MVRCSLLWILWALLVPGYALAVVTVEPRERYVDLSSSTQVLRAAPDSLTIDDVTNAQWQSSFVSHPRSGGGINLGMTADAVWLRIELELAEKAQRDWILDIPYGHLRSIDWFIPVKDGMGYVLASELNAPLPNYRYYAQPVTLHPGMQTLYARVQGYGNLTLPLQMEQASVFVQHESNHLVVQALYFGALAVLLMYALLFGWSVRDRTYGFLSAFLLSSGLAIFVGNGLARLYVWSAQTVFEPAVQAASFALAGAFSLQMTQTFFQSVNRQSLGIKALGWFVVAYLLVALSMFARLWIAFDITNLEIALSILTLVSAFLVMAVVWGARSVGRSQIYFLGAWVIVWLGALVAAMRSLDWIASHGVTLYAIQLSTGMSAVLFSAALFVRVRQQYQERLLAQQEALQAREALIQHLQDAERRLEVTVNERTAQLQSSLAAEKRLREQYVRFGAMISHEFRNPLGVIETQTSLLQREIKAGIDHVDKRIGSVRSAAQRLALLFEKWLQSDRLQNAMDKLEAQPIEFDGWFHDLVGKCHAYHTNHHITCHIEGPIGMIYADERLLQIAILNLIDNACKYSAAQTEVDVSAQQVGQELLIQVTDQGQGIAQENLEKVFDAYFRVDQNSPVLGVGLGLPFVRKIITLHHGEVLAEPNPTGQGTRFTIHLPLMTPM
jgi:signal transduction histidine kinase